jgi:hypothetical protein
MCVGVYPVFLQLHLLVILLHQESSKPDLTGVLIFTIAPNKVTKNNLLGLSSLKVMASQIVKVVGFCWKFRDT